MFDLMISQAVAAFNPFSAVWNAIKQALGFIINSIYKFFELFGIEDLALSLLAFTIVVYTLLLPLTIKQQKTSKLSAVMNPEIQKVTNKYKNKNDQDSMMKQNEELKMIYEKYGTSPTGGCLSSFISLPILLALYRVIYNLKEYAPDIKDSHFFGYAGINIQQETPLSFTKDHFKEAIAGKEFLTLFIILIVVIVPLLSGLFQYLSTKMINTGNTQSAEDNPMGSTMKTMNIFMPIFSIWICYTLPVGVGLYWTFSSLYRVLSQLVINRKFDKISVEDMVKQNLEKVNKKRKKKGLPPKKITTVAKTNTRNIEEPKNHTEQKKKQIQNSTDYYKNANANPNSLRAKANMVQQYNEKNKKK